MTYQIVSSDDIDPPVYLHSYTENRYLSIERVHCRGIGIVVIEEISSSIAIETNAFRALLPTAMVQTVAIETSTGPYNISVWIWALWLCTGYFGFGYLLREISYFKII